MENLKPRECARVMAMGMTINDCSHRLRTINDNTRQCLLTNRYLAKEKHAEERRTRQKKNNGRKMKRKRRRRRRRIRMNKGCRAKQCEGIQRDGQAPFVASQFKGKIYLCLGNKILERSLTTHLHVHVYACDRPIRSVSGFCRRRI